MLTELEKKVVASLQKDLPLTARPFRSLADGLQIPEDLFLNTLKELCRRGVIRRFGATIRHQKSGFKANAMVAWRVDEERIQEVGRLMAGFGPVSHCYRRNPSAEWPYNLYTMVHARDEAACRRIARQMSDQAAVETYTLLFSRRELKKTSMAYFQTDEDF